MKVFEFNWQGSIDWVLSNSQEEAEEFYKNESSNSDLDDYKITELSEKQSREYSLIDPNEPEPDEDEEDYCEDDYCSGYKILESFHDYALDPSNQYNHIICSNEF